MTRTALLVFSLLLTAGPAWGLRATSHLDALEATLANRAASLAGATDKVGKKQLKAAEKSLARIAVDTASLAEDLKLAKKIAGPVAKAYATDDEVMDLLTAAADAFEGSVDTRADLLARARAPLPEAKLTKKADRLLAKAGKAREKSRTQTKLKKRLNLLYKAQRSADKAADVLARALGEPTPTRLVLTPESALFTESGESRSFSTIVLDQLDRPLATSVSWSSTDPTVASVGGDGSVTSGAVGSAQIVATVGALEARAVVVSARPAPGAIPVPDSAVVGPLLASDPESFGIGAEYTAVLRGNAPSLGALLYGTGQLPIGGEVVAVEPSGSDWLVTLAIVPLDVLFAELEIRETIELSDEGAEVPEEISELFDAELEEDGTWVFTEREGVDATAPRQARGAVQGTVAQQGPFECKSPVVFPLSLAAGISMSLTQNFAIDLEYGTAQGLERLVLGGQITAQAAFKPRVNAAVTASVECKAELLKLRIALPPPLTLVFGSQIPVGIGFKIEGSIQAAQFGFDAVAQFQSTTSAGIQCTDDGECEPVTTSTNASTATFAWVTPDPSTQFTVSAAARGFGYAELCLGNPLWELLQLCMLEAQGGVEQTVSWSPTTVQFNNTTAASNYKLLLYFLIGAKAELTNVLQFFTINLASLQYRQDFELARSPEGSFSFEGPVALGETARATLQLTNVDYLGVENVQDVRFYRRDSSLSLIEKAVVQRASPGQTTYEATWPATSGDLGAEFGAVVVTDILPLEFEVAPNSLRTLEQATSNQWTLEVEFPASVPEDVPRPLVVDVTDANGSPVPEARIELEATGGTLGASSGTTDSEGRFETTARLSAGQPELTIVIDALEEAGGLVRATETVVAIANPFALDSFLWNTANGCNSEGWCTHVNANTPTELNFTTTYTSEFNPLCAGLTASAHAVVLTNPDGVVTITGEFRADETADCAFLSSQALIRFSVEGGSYGYELEVDLSENPRNAGVALSQSHLQGFGVGSSPIACVPASLTSPSCPDPPPTTGVLQPGPFTVFARTFSESIRFTLTLTP